MGQKMRSPDLDPESACYASGVGCRMPARLVARFQLHSTHIHCTARQRQTNFIDIVSISHLERQQLIYLTYRDIKTAIMAPNNLPSIFNATSQDIEMLLAAQCHLGSKNLQVHMEPYLWKTRPDGINVINIGKTWY